jgi:RNA-binding signal recognition particle 68
MLPLMASQVSVGLEPMRQHRHARMSCLCRYLHIPLMNAERAWAYAQDLKREVEAAGGHAPDKRHHSIRRLTKAAMWAAELSRLAAARCDAREWGPESPTAKHVEVAMRLC